MKLIKILWFSLISLSMLTNVNASRVKKDLVAMKENEIIALLEKKMSLLDKLIVEAEIYSQEIDPLGLRYK